MQQRNKGKMNKPKPKNHTADTYRIENCTFTGVPSGAGPEFELAKALGEMARAANTLASRLNAGNAAIQLGPVYNNEGNDAARGQ